MHLVPRYRQKLAHVPYGQGRPVWVDDPHFNARYHVRHSALPSPGSDEQLRNLAGPPVRPAAGPDQAAVGAQPRRGARGRPLRDHLEDPSRARGRRQRRRHHLGALRPLARRHAAGGRGTRVGAASGAERRRAAGPGAGRARDGAGRGRPGAARAHARAAPGRSGTPANGSSASAPWRGRGSTPRRRRPSTCRSARTGATHGSTPRWRASRRSRTPWAARSTTSCCRRSTLALGRFLRRRGDRDRRARAQGDGPGLGARGRRSGARSATASPPCGRRCPWASPTPRRC